MADFRYASQRVVRNGTFDSGFFVVNNLLPNIIIGIVGIVLLMAFIGSSGGSPDLQVQRWGAIRADDGFAFNITNVDRKTITVASTRINDRADCTATPISLVGAKTFPLQLKVGDKVTFVSSCHVVRVEVETDAGSAEFSF